MADTAKHKLIIDCALFYMLSNLDDVNEEFADDNEIPNVVQFSNSDFTEDEVLEVIESRK